MRAQGLQRQGSQHLNISIPVIHLGQTPLTDIETVASGDYVERDGETFYRINHVDSMPEFFISIVSPSDHWLFTTSSGGITAGRANAENALFPYYTEDKIRDGAAFTGSRTILLVKRGDRTYLWEPLHPYGNPVYRTERSLYKSRFGNALIFREENYDLGLRFEYGWRTSDRFGFIKTSSITNTGSGSIEVDILDGLENLLPYGASTQTQNELSCLLDAYKRAELDASTGLGMYTMSSTLSDKAEPSEALSATTVWSTGLTPKAILLSSSQITRFRKGAQLSQETDVRGQRGAYIVNASISLDEGAERRWSMVAEVNQSAAATHNLRHALATNGALHEELEDSARTDCLRLREIIATADGFQLSGDQPSTHHHTMNVLFNLLRGGTVADGYTIKRADFLEFCQSRNRMVAQRLAAAFDAELPALPKTLTLQALKTWAAESKCPDYQRLTLEYLPITFSRRHGDPSRPWNQFNIKIHNADGSPHLYYEGNWRDIFQNWEALSLAYPDFIESMICKFLNATTADGYNPYRLTSLGIDWEAPNPDDPWSNIGYWGDHQIIYLLKLLELSNNLHPDGLSDLLLAPIFSYANVPYRIRTYDDLLKDPRDSIEFLPDLDQALTTRSHALGSDQKLMTDPDGEVIHVNMIEKLLVPVLAKLSNFVPEAGIWLNTQRPEWNDANNALAGYGASVVTLNYLHRHLLFLERWLDDTDLDAVSLSKSVYDHVTAIQTILESNESTLLAPINDEDRRQIQDQLGRAGCDYRQGLYQQGLSQSARSLPKDALVEFLKLSRSIIAQSIRANRREDGLYHAYNLLEFKEGRTEVDTLYEMLEGQVAVLSAQLLPATEALEVLEALQASAMYDRRRDSYQLYPDRTLTPFLQKNVISQADIASSTLLSQMIEQGMTTIIEQDALGQYHFNGSFQNVDSLRDALSELQGTDYEPLAAMEKEDLEALFERTFHHHEFTGRSGGMYAYEGLGSIYWHMVGKLLLAAAENVDWALKDQAPSADLQALVAKYEAIRGGMGFNKSPAEYGAFPDDPYSHTPSFGGARQPGMTGQVKEEILARFMELGVRFERGAIRFSRELVRPDEFLTSDADFEYFDSRGQWRTLSLKAGEYAFTLCQIPIVVSEGSEASIDLQLADGKQEAIEGDTISQATSQRIFSREASIELIRVCLETN